MTGNITQPEVVTGHIKQHTVPLFLFRAAAERRVRSLINSFEEKNDKTMLYTETET